MTPLTTVACLPQLHRVEPADLAEESVRLPRDANSFARSVAALAKAYLCALDHQGDVEQLLLHLDPAGFEISLPTGTLRSQDDFKTWYRGIVSTYANPRHTVVAFEPTLLENDSAQLKLSIHFEADKRDPQNNEPPRANFTVDRIWGLKRTPEGRWVISNQRAQEEAAPGYSESRVRQFAVEYLDNLDRRDLEGMLTVLAPQGELNIVLNGGEVIEDFRRWFENIKATFTKSKHTVLGLVPVSNADGTIDAYVRIRFTADRTSPEPHGEQRVDLSVDRIWTLRQDRQGKPQLVSQRPFAPFEVSKQVAVPDVDGAIEAVRARDNEIVRDWLRNGGDPNAYGPDGFNVFLAAASRGNFEVLRMLLVEKVGPRRVDPTCQLRDHSRPAYRTGVLAPHLSTQRGDIPSTLLLLSCSPQQLRARIEVNGHTPLLQIAFYGHVELARAVLSHLRSIVPGIAEEEARRSLFAATTVRGINATQLGRQFQNHAMVDVLEKLDNSTMEERVADTRALLCAIPGGPRNPEAQTPAQQASEAVYRIITAGLAEVAGLDEPARSQAVARILHELLQAIASPHFEPNRLAGELLQTPIIAAVTGTNANEGVARLRREMVGLLLASGASPDTEEEHPMGVDAVIRAAVFNHYDCLLAFERMMGSAATRAALDHKPAVNGLTALHDSVLRAATGSKGYLEQIRWARKLGASVDIPEHTGRTQRDFAVAAFVTEGQRENAAAVWDALAMNEPPPVPYEMFNYENLTFLTIPRVTLDKGTVWRALSTTSRVVVKSIDLDGPNAMSAEVVQNHSFGTAIMNREWPDGRLVAAKEVQAFAVQTRGTPLLPIMRFKKTDSYIKELLGAGLFGALIENPSSTGEVSELLRNVYFPERPNANSAPKTSTAQHPLGKRAVGADNIAQRTFAEFAKMMDTLNDMFIAGITFSKPAEPAVLAGLCALKEEGVRLIEIDHALIRDALAPLYSEERLVSETRRAVSAIEDSARDAGLVLSGKFSQRDEILDAFERGYRHIITLSEKAARETAWRSWVPGGVIAGRTPHPREMPIRPPSGGVNDMRQALAAGQLVVFGALTTPSPNHALALAHSGILNSVAIEREHGTWTTEDVLAHIELLKKQTHVMVRLGDALDTEVGTFIAAGVSALIATAVRNAAEAQHFLAAVEKANLEIFGEDDKQKWAVPVVMMETEGAANDAVAIVTMLQRHQGVCHPGPLDLSASLGAAWGTPRYESTLAKIEGTAKAYGVPLAGVFGTLKESLDRGLGLVLAPMGMDAGALNTGIIGTNPLQSLANDNSA